MQSISPKCTKSVDRKSVICPLCNYQCVKNGKTKNGTQRYRCRYCGKSCLSDYRNKACVPGLNLVIKQYIKEGCGIKSISRLLQISATTVLRRIVRIARAVSKPAVFMGKEYELDELCTYVKQKAKQLWVVYAIRRDTREVVDFTVGSRTNKTLKRVTDTLVLSCARRVFTNKLSNYKTLLPAAIHCTMLHGTNHIERKNLDLRTHLKRLGRRSICFSKSVAMLSACLYIYFWG